MTDLLARCRNDIAPCAFETPCRNAAHKAAVEQTHLERWHAALPPETDELCRDLVAQHPDDRIVIEQAIRAVAIVNNGRVDPNVVRELIPATVTPQMVGAVYRAMRMQGQLKVIDENLNTDKRGRNVGKKQPVYALVDEAGAATTHHLQSAATGAS